MMMFSIGCCIQASTLLIGFTAATAKQDTWMIVISGYILTLPIIWIYYKLASRFPGKSIVEIDDLVFGKILGKVFSVLYILFYFSLAFLNTNVIGDFTKEFIMPETPKAAIVIMFISLCMYAVRKGIETLARCSTLFVSVILVAIIINSILLIQNMKLSNFLPAFTLPVKSYIQATHTEIFLPFGDIFMYFMLFPSLPDNVDIKKPLFGGLMIGAATMLLVVLRDTAVLGPVISIVSNPAFETVRLINIANTLTRMEIFYATVLFMLLFFKISIVFYATVKGISQIFGLDSYKFLVPTVGALIIVFSIIDFPSSIAHEYWGENVAAFYSTFFILILPLTTLIAVAVKKFTGGREAKP